MPASMARVSALMASPTIAAHLAHEFTGAWTKSIPAMTTVLVRAGGVEEVRRVLVDCGFVEK